MQDAFLKRMENYLQEEYVAYVETLQKPAFRGLRVNTSKIAVEAFKSMAICTLRPSKICSQSFYIEDDVKGLGNHPAHIAGLFYMQEPSASSAVEVLNVQKGDWVLDMCAAPGGKSTQIAAALDHTGFFVSNEIDTKRSRILLSNMERLGFSEGMITSSHPQLIAKEMQGWFDKVLVDAPCSGEGMFKKHSAALEDWSLEHVKACAMRQLQILDSAYLTLKKDGILVYSTCTYAKEENEDVVAAFLAKYPDMELVDANVTFGRSGMACAGLQATYVRRIYPMDEGEGHFIARMKKNSEEKKAKMKVAQDVLDSCVTAFLTSQLKEQAGNYLVLQDKVYKKKGPFIKLKDINILRQGILCGEIVKKRFEPHQHFYSAAIHQTCFQQVYPMQDAECISFMQGNVLQVAGYKGYTLCSWKGFPIGFAKGDGNVLKNKFPKGLRIQNPNYAPFNEHKQSNV